MNDYVNKRNEWIFARYSDITHNKSALTRSYVFTLLRRLQQLFKWNNLPETIPQKDLEIMLQAGGYATFKDVDGKLYAFYSGLGGKPNVYYLPTISIVANPALSYSASLEIDKDCVVMLNDSLYEGLMPLISKYAELLAECDISMRIAAVNSRIPSFVQADNDVTRESAKKFISDMTEGAENGIIASSKFFEGIKTFNFNENTDNIRNLIELRQYLFGSLFNELGLEAQFNMKREALNSSETSVNKDILKPMIDDMLEQRRIGAEKINKMFGTNITVEFNSVWEENEQERKAELEILKNEAKGESEDEKKVGTGSEEA